VSDTNIITRSVHKKYIKEVSRNDQKIEMVINTGSDIYLMHADQNIRVDTSKLKKNTIQFCDVDSGDNVTLGDIDHDSIMTLDNGDYPIRIRVISDMLMKVARRYRFPRHC